MTGSSCSIASWATTRWHTFFEPHNEHWSTLPILAFRALYSVFGVRSYLPYGIAAIAVHLLACLTMRSLLLRVRVNPWVVTAIVTIFAFLGAGSENMLWDFQIGFLGSVLFGLVALRVAVSDAGTWKPMVGVWSALVLGLMTSGMAIPMTFFCFFYYLFSASLRRAILAISVPIVVYLGWYAAYGHKGGTKYSTHLSDYTKVPDFALAGLTNIWSSITGVEAFGVILLVALALAPLFDRITRPVTAVALAGVAAAIGQFSIIGLSRIQFGVGESNAERYLYVGAVLTLPALALLLTMVAERVRRFPAVGHCLLALIVVAVSVRGIQFENDFTNFRVSLENQLRPQIQGALSIVTSGQQTISRFPSATYDPDITVEKLATKDVRDAFGTVRPTPQGLIDAAAHIQVGVSTSRYPVGPATSIGGSGVTGLPTSVGCSTVTVSGAAPYLELQPAPSGAMISLTVPVTSVQTTLLRDGFTSVPVSWPVTAGVSNYVATSTTDATLRIALPTTGPITVCQLS